MNFIFLTCNKIYEFKTNEKIIITNTTTNSNWDNDPYIQDSVNFNHNIARTCTGKLDKPS